MRIKIVQKRVNKTLRIDIQRRINKKMDWEWIITWKIMLITTRKIIKQV